MEVMGNYENNSAVLVRGIGGSVTCLGIVADGSISPASSIPSSKSCRIGLSPTSAQFCVSDGTKLSVYSAESPDPIFWFLSSTGPCRFSKEDDNVIFHGGLQSISVFDMREGCAVSSIGPHPGCVTMGAYSNDRSYSLLSLNPVRTTELAAYSSTNQLVQLFDSRHTRSPLFEFALPGRETRLWPQLRYWDWRTLEYSPDGKQLIISRPGNLTAFVIAIDGPDCVSPMAEIPVCPTRNEQVRQYNARTIQEERETDLRRKRMATEGYITRAARDTPMECSLGVSFNQSGQQVLSISSFGNLYLTSSGDADAASIPDTTRQVVKREFTHAHVKDPSIIPLSDITTGLSKLESVKSVKTILRSPEQFWVQNFVGLARGIGVCALHPNNGVPGSYYWNECVNTCKLRQRSGPPKGVRTGSIRVTSVHAVIAAYNDGYGVLLPDPAVRAYLAFLSTESVEWCTIRFEDDVLVVKYHVVPPVPRVRKSRSIRPVIEPVEAADTPPLPQEETIFSSSSSDDEGDGIAVFGGRKELVKPNLLVTELHTPDVENHRLINPTMIAKLREKWGAGSKGMDVAGDTHAKPRVTFQPPELDEDVVFGDAPAKRTAGETELPTPPSARARRQAGF